MLNTLQAFKNKISKRFQGVVHVPAKSADGTKKGIVLLSYITGPFTRASWQHFSDPHTSYWECGEIARLFSERGYDVDIIDWDNETFVPRKSYAVCVDIQKNLERLVAHLPKECVKVMHVVSAYAEFQNTAEQKRLADVKARRGVVLAPRRAEIVSQNPAIADVLEGFGNKTIHATYSQFGKTIFPIHESVSRTFDFPENKDFEYARKNFLWFGGGGAVHKSLDLILEAFAKLPYLHLHIVGPVAKETDFMEAYAKELSLPNIHLYGRPKLSDRVNKDGSRNMIVDGRPFTEITDQCAILISPSCSEGTSGAVVQAMHAGLFPVITPETGIDEAAPSIILRGPTVDKIREIVLELSNLPGEQLQKMAFDAWTFARSFYTKQTFTESYSRFLDTILK